MSKIKLVDNYIHVEIGVFDCKNFPIRVNIPKIVFEDNTSYDEIKNCDSIKSIMDNNTLNFLKDCGFKNLDTIKIIHVSKLASRMLNSQKFFNDNEKLVKHQILVNFLGLLWVIDDVYDTVRSNYNKIMPLFGIIKGIVNGMPFDNNDTFLRQNKDYFYACNVIKKFKQQLDDFIIKSKGHDINLKDIERHFIQDFQSYLDSIDWDVRRRFNSSKTNYVYPKYEISVLQRHGNGAVSSCMSLFDILFNVHNIRKLPRIGTMINFLDHITSLSIVYLNDVVSTNREVKQSVSESEFKNISIDSKVKELPIELLVKIPIDTVMSRSYNYNISIRESLNLQIVEYEKCINNVVQLYNEIQDCLTINEGVSDKEQTAILFRVHCSVRAFPNWQIFDAARYGVKQVGD